PPAPPPATPPTAPAVAVPTPPPVPARRLIACDVRYVFSRVNASGRPVALVEILDPGRPGTAPAVRQVGVDDVVFGMRIQSFTDQSLVLTDASGRRHTVAFGGSSRVVGELESAP
ncbi:MAG: hypothetical protein GX595_10515, partial [Lentisphaerae bacterium]|nr:hypothetical protein [Lentisphaerota bacterium]